MILVGLTGSIGMGKTTTANMFKKLGAAVFDADGAVHKLYDRGGAAVALIRAVFPDAVKNGAVDRQVLSRHMHEDPLNLEVLESFVHPMVSNLRKQAIKAAKAKNKDVFIIDIPLLFETNQQEKFDKIIVVSARPDIQKSRVLKRPEMTPQKYEFILGRQVPDNAKRENADYVITTNDGLEHTMEQVKTVMQDLRMEAAVKEKSNG